MQTVGKPVSAAHFRIGLYRPESSHPTQKVVQDLALVLCEKRSELPAMKLHSRRLVRHLAQD